MDSAGSDRDNAINGPLHSGYKGAHAKELSKEERLHFQSPLLDALGQALIATDLQGKIIHWNRGAENLYGWSAKEVLGRSIIEVTPSEELMEQAGEIMAELLAGRSWSGEFVVRRKDGTTFPALVTDTPVHDEHGNLIAIIGVSTDITDLKHTEELRRSEERFRLLVEGVKDYAIFMLDVEGRITSWNAGAQRINGYRIEEIIGRHFSVFYLLEDIERGHPEEELRLAQEQGQYEEEGLRVRKDGSRFWASVLITALRDEEGNLRGFSKVVRDVTERRRAEEALRSSEEFFKALYENVSHPIFLVDEDLNFVDVNPFACEFYGYSREEFRHMNVSDITLPEERNDQLRQIERLRKAGKVFVRERRHRKKNGEIVTVTADATKVTRSGQELYVSKITDITERKRAEEQLLHQAFHDHLTGLPNRYLLVDRLRQALRQTSRLPGRRVAVLFVDLDDFKAVNDSLGHEVGDKLLVAVSERLRSCIRPEDTLARFGGDEFIVLLEEVDGPDDALRVAERITEEFRVPIRINGRELFVRISNGVALGTSRQKSAEDLLKEADTAMYRAKAEGMDYRVFDPQMYLRAINRLELENDLRRAIEAEEFVVHYQPIVDLDSGEMRVVEALVRWNHPERGLLDPDEFVPVSEESGLIIPMGEQVLEEACRQAKEWQEEHPRIPPMIMSVNFSARQLQRSDLATTVQETLRRTGFEASCLTLDITETVYIKVLEGNTQALDELKGLGLRIAIDDFGVGYSSLSYLKHLPADALKIDKSFTKGIGEDVEDTAIVRMIIELAHTLGMEVIAEGVEDRTQAALLREMGCDMAQGFFFSEPLPSEEAAKFLAEERTL